VHRMKWAHKSMWWSLFGACTVGYVTGCSPALQQNVASARTGTPVQAGEVWQNIVSAAESAEATGKYMVKMNVDASDSASHSQMSLYGYINPPNKAALDIVESNNDVQYYQQGNVAYYKDNGRWTQTTPFSEVDVFPSYLHLAQYGLQQTLPLVQLPDVYVNTEYCKVYQTTVPASALDTLPILGGKVNQKGLKSIQYTFFVGKSDKLLREVQTQSVGDLANVGSLQVSSDTILFNLGQKTADVQIPPDLVKQLEDSGT
jgi:hypothetical protein